MSTRSPSSDTGPFIGASPVMQKVYQFTEKAAGVDLPVLIVGETGTGKELVANAIHRQSGRAEAPFVAVNTGALTPELIASELFGHVKGSFTGAVENTTGRFREAHGGTLFLDEVATMDERTQVALLRVLDSGTFRPVGAQVDLQADVRIIAATNLELQDLVDRGSFRGDLLHRFQVMRIDMPPLRKHAQDIPDLARSFLSAYDDEYQFHVEDFSEDALDLLKRYEWPGNVRELKNVVAQAAVMTQEGRIRPEHLPEYIRNALEKAEAASRKPAETGDKEDLDIMASPVSSNGGRGLFIPLGKTLDEVQRVYTEETLAHCSNNKTRAAKLLGISRKTLHDRLNRWKEA